MRINRILTIAVASLYENACVPDSPRPSLLVRLGAGKWPPTRAFLFELSHLFDEFTRVCKLSQQTVDGLDRCAAALGDATSSATVDDLGLVALLDRHGTDDGLHVPQRFLIHHGEGPLRSHSPRQHLDQRLQGTQVAHLAQLSAKVLQRELRAQLRQVRNL